MKRLLLILATGLFLAVVPATTAGATTPRHPLGNLTVNTLAELRIEPDRIAVDYVVDMAEIPALQARQGIDRNRDGHVDAAESSSYATSECDTLAAGLFVSAGAGAAMPAVVSGATTLSFPPGQGGLTLLRLECAMSARLTAWHGDTSLHFVDRNFADRIGWRETTAVGDGTTLVSSPVGTASVTGRLTAYPTLTNSPPRDLDVTLVARPGGARLSDTAVVDSHAPATVKNRTDRLSTWFTGLIGDHPFTPLFALLAVLAAIVLGTFHAIAPGHGKTMMAAYVVGQRGTVGQVVGIGLTVAATHTAGVLLLGFLVLGSQSFAPDQLLPWLSIASGALLAATGVWLASRRLRGFSGHHLFGAGHPHTDADHGHEYDGDHDHVDGHDHAHDHDHAYDHHGHGAHGHHGHAHHERDRGRPSRKSLVVMGVAGGMVPTPSALVVLLGAVALGRTWFGIVLVAAYGVGMAAMLTSAGFALVRAQRWLEQHWDDRPALKSAMRIAPMVTAGLLVLGGLSIVLRARGKL